MQWREDDDVGLRDGQRGQRRTGDRDAAVEQIVGAVIGIDARGDGTRGHGDSGIIRARGMLEILRSDAHAGEFRAVRAGVRDVPAVVDVLDRVVVVRGVAVIVLDRVVVIRGVAVIMTVHVEVELEPVVVAVIRVAVRRRDPVGVRREDVVQAQVEVRRDLDPEDPQHHREPPPDARPRRALAGDGGGATHRRERRQDSPGPSAAPTRRTPIGIARRPARRRRSVGPSTGVWEAPAR